MSTTRIGRTVAEVPCSAFAAAARFVEREWGEGYCIGYAGKRYHADDHDYPLYVFQARAGDGSRFLVAADRWENTRHLEGETARELARICDVEAHD